MSNSKPMVFYKDQSGRDRVRKKREGESLFAVGGLSLDPPAELKGCPAGRRAWRFTLKVYSELPGEVLNQLDKDFLISYCLAVEGRSKAFSLESKISKLFSDGDCGLDEVLRCRAELRMATRLVTDLSRGLYLNPRSRTGVVPSARQSSPEEIVAAEMEDLKRLLGDGE